MLCQQSIFNIYLLKISLEHVLLFIKIGYCWTLCFMLDILQTSRNILARNVSVRNKPSRSILTRNKHSKNIPARS